MVTKFFKSFAKSWNHEVIEKGYLRTVLRVLWVSIWFPMFFLFVALAGVTLSVINLDHKEFASFIDDVF